MMMTESIKAINRDSIHRICSGQVVLSLAIAVKELVENSLDAGATIIDIRLKEYGSDLVEVSDNGSGALAANFQALTLKHYTSKIEQFDDLAHLSTLGFRGEALSSLCALSDLAIVTKHTTSENATKIIYDRNGKIVSEITCAREPGTTVTLENLFTMLPVRRKEFLKNLKREFNKMCQLLYAYCLVSKDVKFSCTNTTQKGAKSTVVATAGSNAVKDNIVNVFGAKQVASLIEVELVQPDNDILAEYGLTLVEGEPLPFTFDFFVSSVSHGSGRSSNDRQFFYINSRPCEPTKIIKLVNDVYKQYNSSQYPFVYLNVYSNSCLVDVNVTPDKRQVFLEKEKVLLAVIKASLIEAFKSFPSMFRMQNLDLTQNTTIKDFFGDEGSSRGLKRGMSDSAVKKGGILERFKKRSKTDNDKNCNSDASFKPQESSYQKLDSFIEIASRIVEKEFKDESELEETQTETKKPTENATKCGLEILEIDTGKATEIVEEFEENRIVCEARVENIKTTKRSENIEENIGSSCNKIVTAHVKNEHVTKKKQQVLCNENSENIETPEESPKLDLNNLKALEECIIDDDVELKLDSSVRNPSDYKSVTLNTSIDHIKELVKKRKLKSEEEADVKVRFRCQINPESNKSAEEELQKQISKEDFKKMIILGQFNLGFIVTKLQNDLFIIDQHASDEKYNFEDLQANTVMEHQLLVNPKPLQLTAGHESLLIENEEIFKKNGFKFHIDETAPCTKKVSLTGIPLSKNIVFGKDDIDEMLFILQHANHMMCRPTRVRAMFASRACRKSVMIGKALSKSDMRRLVDHMSEIEQPWNCPHGRPTMRHLINLDLIEKDE